ncbi:MAG: hypothetical protein M3Y84_11440, partial [Acidobacteriota bacterium]|nr:hypothetical protein [Acidobacteriota bacterium]
LSSGKNDQGGQVGNLKDEEIKNADGKSGDKGRDVARATKVRDLESADTNGLDFRGGDILLEEIEHFFISYNTFKGKQFKPLGRFGPDRAKRLIQEGIDRFRGKSR